MARRFTIAFAVVAAVTLSAFGTMQARRAQPATDSGGRIVAAANAYLATLDPDQRAKARLDLNAKTRTVWSNLPTGIAMQVGATERNGLKLGAMTPAQEKAALALVAAALSRDGYQKVMAIVDADQCSNSRAHPAVRRRQGFDSAVASTTWRFSARRRRPTDGCCNSADTISPSTSHSRAAPR